MKILKKPPRKKNIQAEFQYFYIIFNLGSTQTKCLQVLIFKLMTPLGSLTFVKKQ